MVAVGREAHLRMTENPTRIDPEGVAEIWISPIFESYSMPARSSIPIVPHGASPDVCDPLRGRIISLDCVSGGLAAPPPATICDRFAVSPLS